MRTPSISNSQAGIPAAEHAVADHPRAVNWRGQSGRYYALSEERLDNFVLKDHELYVIAEGNTARWIGTAGDLIEDQVSRAQFRSAVKVASAVLRFGAPSDAIDCMKTKWDLEGGQLAGALSLVP